MSYVICSNEAAQAATPLPAPELNAKGQKSSANVTRRLNVVIFMAMKETKVP